MQQEKEVTKQTVVAMEKANRANPPEKPQARPDQSNQPTKKKSVAEFQHEKDLLKDLVLEQMDLPVGRTEDWALARINLEDTAVKTLHDEHKRLTVLKSFNIAGVKGVDSIDRLVSTGAAIFNVPLCVVSLVDLRRLWFLGTHGFGELREIPRKETLCSHAVCTTNDILVVPDCTKDKRFDDHFTVTGAPYLRFYAGACLKSPEGYNIGNFCVLDTKPHPEGLNETQTKILKDLAAIAMKILEDQRYRQEMETVKRPLLAQTAHELMTPLTAINLSLEALKGDDSISSNPSRRDIVETAAASADLMTNICRKTISMMQDSPAVLDGHQNASKFVRVTDLIAGLDQIVRPVPKSVPVFFHADPTAAQVVLKNDLALFRISLGLISSACARTNHGSILFKVTMLALSVGDKEADKGHTRKLLFECRDTAGPMSSQDRSVFTIGKSPTDSRLNSLSQSSRLVQSIGGTCGHHEFPDGTSFWFAVQSCFLSSQPAEKGLGSLSSNSLCVLPLKRPFDKVVANASPTADIQHVLKRQKAIEISSPLFRRGRSLPLLLDGSGKLEFLLDTNSKANSHFERTAANKSSETPKHKGAPRIPMTLIGLAKNANPKQTIPSHKSDVSPVMTEQWNKRVLVIDDSLVIRKSLSRSLSRLGYEVTVAENGQEGLEKMKDNMFDFVLCDFLMPVMDGLDCVKQFREWERRHRPWFYQCIFGISAHANTHDLHKGIVVGMDEYFKKPISFKLLEELPDSAKSLRSTRNHRPTGPMSGLARESSVQTTGIGNPMRKSSSAKPSCLVASTDVTVSNLEQRGWACIRACSDERALELLKKRNWDAVIIEGRHPSMSGFETMRAFRDWEKHNRVNRQQNVFLLCSGLNHDSMETNASYIHAPEGFDGALRSEQLVGDFQFLVRRESDPHSGVGSTLSIITHCI